MKKRVFVSILLTLNLIFACFFAGCETPNSDLSTLPEQEENTEIPAIIDPSTNKESLSYLFGGSTVSYLRNLENTNNLLRTVCPDYFDIDYSGQLLITPANKIDESFINNMHNNNALVVPFISNHWNRTLGEIALDNRHQLSTQVADLIKQYNLDGVNVDIENVTDIYADKYTDFVRLLKQKLPKDKIVSVAVAANPNGWDFGWHGSYDYYNLANNCDYLMVMSYDESYYGGPPGPVSSIQFFENSIQYALSIGVEKAKIVMGVPFFGRYWKQGASIGGHGIAVSDIEFLINNYQSEVFYDEYSTSSNAYITITSEDVKPIVWGGRVLYEGTYNIWYDDLTAVKEKLNMIKEYNIAGVGSWALGQENIELWNVYNNALDGTRQARMQANNLRAIDSAKYSSIARLAYMLEQEGGEWLQKDIPLTKGEVLIILANVSLVKPVYNAKTLKNNVDYYFGKEKIVALEQKGIVADNNNFNPNETITKAELAIILDKMLELPNTINFHLFSFTDVDYKHPAYNQISKMAYYGILNANNTFEPNKLVTLADLATVLDSIDYFNYELNPDKILMQKKYGKKITDPIWR